MTEDLMLREVHGIQVGQRRSDGYCDLTAMCQAWEKRLYDYTRLDKTKEYLEALFIETGIPANELIQTVRGAPETGGGSWGHPLVAIDLAQWIDVHFKVQVNKWYYEWCQTKQNPLVSQTLDPHIAALVQISSNNVQAITGLTGKVIQHEQQLSTHEERITNAENKLNDMQNYGSDETNYFAVIAWARIRRVQIPQIKSQIMGQRSARLCRQRGIEIKRIKDARWGWVNLYPIEILDEVWRDIMRVSGESQ
jgi:hypothetical protein